jgi:hypothetical protein
MSNKPRCGRETNTKMNLKASQFEDMEWINMAYRRAWLRDIVNTVMNSWVP